MGQPVIIGLVTVYAGALFLIAWRVDKRDAIAGGRFSTIVIYSLSIAVYFTSWTYFGAVGTAETRGWEYLAIYLGPFLIFSLGRPLMKRMIERGKSIHSTSIADFISAHYRKSRAIAALVTTIAVFAALPYIALQLKSVATTFTYLANSNSEASAATNIESIIPIATTLAIFAIMFGTKNVDVTRQNRGMIAAIAFDSIIKLAALFAVGLFALFLAPANTLSPGNIASTFNVGVSIDRFVTLTFLSMAAILCLPRQFHVTVVECGDPKYLNPASRIFLAYLVVISLLVIPITLVSTTFQELAEIPSDLMVLALPLTQGANGLALAVFVGGFAAATAMVIVASVALSTMITNDLIAPFLLRRKTVGSTPPELGLRLLEIRRISIVILLAIAALFAAYAPEGEQLASLGILSFAAVAQFAPALIAGLFWRRASPLGAFWGMLIGFVLWFFLLLAPSYDGQSATFLMHAAAWVNVLQWDPLTIGVMISVSANIMILVALSLISVKTGGWFNQNPARVDYEQRDNRIRAADLYLLIQRCLGETDAWLLIDEFEAGQNRKPDPNRIAGPALIAFADKQISKAIGAPSASILLKSVLAGGTLQLDDVAILLGETSGKVQFSQEILQATLENTSHGVSVVDEDLRLVAWNKAYVDMYDYPPELIQEGRPIEDLIRFNANRGEFGPKDTDDEVSRRLAHLRAGARHSFERTRPNGSVVRIEGVQSAGGLYVTTFTDVSDYKRVEKALIDSERSIRFYTDNIPAMASFVDNEERFQFANSAYRKAFDLKEEDIGATLLSDVMSDQDYQMRKPYVDIALRGERKSFDIEVDINGEHRFMQVAYVPQFAADNTVRGFFGIYLDVTARRAAEVALARTNETLEERVAARTVELSQLNTALETARKEAENATASKTRFLAAASHDVLQPLNAARLFVSALKESQGNQSEITALTDKIDASIGSADLLLRALLNISKLDAGGIEPELRPLDLNKLFHELANDFSLAAEKKGLSLSYVETKLWINSDRGLLLSALQNIVANAVRYTDTGKILIGARRLNNRIRIDIYDTGRGIPPLRQKEIFQEFKRLDRDRDVSGAGLGLATVDRIARLLEAKLELQSVEHKGSRFSLTVPSAKALRPTALIKSPTQRTDKLKGMRIVCIDNDALVLEAMTAALSRWGCETKTYLSDHEALAAPDLWEAAPDLLLLDYQLDNGRTGFDALTTLSEHWGVQPPTIMITAASSEIPEEKSAKLNMPIVSKPIEPAELRALINQMHQRPAQ